MHETKKRRFLLWFFRDISQEQRNKFYGVFGIPMPDDANHETQNHVMHFWCDYSTGPVSNGH